jgi:hypothetical protein
VPRRCLSKRRNADDDAVAPYTTGGSCQLCVHHPANSFRLIFVKRGERFGALCLLL